MKYGTDIFIRLKSGRNASARCGKCSYIVYHFVGVNKMVEKTKEDEGMREIKFRAWSICMNRFLDLTMLEIKNGEVVGIYDDGDYIGLDKSDITIMQYTGLIDKYGMEIYEGDIVSFVDITDTENGYSESNCIGVVRWDKRTVSFDVTNRLSAKPYEVMDEECAVIGNVYENPELLEVGNE